MVALAEQGRLDEIPLPRLLLDLNRAGFGGALHLTRERVAKRFLLQAGVPVAAESNLASESLGVQLMDAGRLARPDYNRVVAHIDQTGTKEGAALLELGLLKPKELFLALKEQVRTRLIECFGWPQGDFRLDPDSEPPADAQAFRVDLYALLQEGIEAHWSSDRVYLDLGANMERYPVPGSRFAKVAGRLHRDAAVDELLTACNGARTLWQAAQQARTPRALAAVWVLDAAGAFDYRERPKGGDAREAAGEHDVELVFEETAGPAAGRARPQAPRPAKRAAAPRAADPRGDALRQEIEDKHARLAELDHYALLGIERGATQGAVKRAYFEAAKRYHPDALARMGLAAEVHEQAARVFGEIGKAHAVLSDAKRRRDYDATLDTDSNVLDANLLAQAETLYRKGEVLLRAGNFRGAIEFLEPSVELWPDECAYQSALGWCLYKKMPSETERAREHLEIASRIDPDDGVNLFRLSVVLRALGEDEAAERARLKAQDLGAG